jgi:DNA-nicking Smr family endonuclease
MKKKEEAGPEESIKGIPSHVVVTDTLDLHGFFPEQVPEMIEAFIQNAKTLRLNRLRVIHGKGRSRLKYEVIHALASNPDVMRFHDAPPDMGGWGATVVELVPFKK